MAGASPPEAVQATFCATLVDEWVRHGVRHAVVAPGSRSTPIVLALAGRPELGVHVFHDERSAGFAALGLGLASGHAAVLVCTSGTAATHFHAAVVEAHQAAVPLLVVTADRPPELRDVGAPQTIDQARLYGTSVRWFHDPGVADAAAASSWRSLAERALTLTRGVHPGPVHLNLPFREPLVGVPGAVPEPLGTGTVPARAQVTDAELATLGRSIDAQRGVIVAGRGAGDPEAVLALSDATGWPVLADPRAGLGDRDGVVRAFDSLLRHGGFARDHAPEVVLRLGEAPASKVLAGWVTGSGAIQVHVGAVPVVVDPDHRVRHRVWADPTQVCRVWASRLRGATGTPWRTRWVHAERMAQAALAAVLDDEAVLTEPGAARTVLRGLPDGAHVVVSSSMPVRDLEWFGGPRDAVTVHANRGANGIDGVVATATGVALATGAPTAVLLGDLALLHDSSSLVGLEARGVDVRIVVVDNGGGGIFSFLPQATALPGEQFERLFGTPHGSDLVALASAHGLPAKTVTSTGELATALRERGPWLVRVASDRAGNVGVHERLHAAVAAALG
jgi:2-succinyl-5-enolpyruvyl-6-hydroxy-3-cyclohexene-1-carboxylate synthase